MKKTLAQTGSSAGASLQEQKALAYAKKGILLALLAGLIFSTDSLLIDNAKGYSPFSNKSLFLLVPFICAGMHDFCSAIVISLLNWRSDRLPEVRRSLVSKPGRFVIGGALLGAFFGTGGYMIALNLAGPAYVLPITSLYPAIAAVLAIFVLKERISQRAWLGLGLCVCGAVVIGYTPPDGQLGGFFYWGLAFAALAAVGWGAQGVYATSGMDFIEPAVALNIHYLVSSVLYLLIVIPVVSFVVLPGLGGAGVLLEFVTSRGAVFVALAGVFGAFSYRCWYNAMNMTGVSRAMALNISYALWGILLSFFFTETSITTNLVIGAVVIFCGIFLVIGNPKDMLNLRKVD